MTLTIGKTAAAFVLALSFAAFAGVAAAKDKGHGHGQGAAHCPPGLAKKSPACVPPGQAMKAARYYQRGDEIDIGHAHLILHPGRYELPPLRAGERYYIMNGQLLRVDEGTYRVLDFIRAGVALLD